ncbi:MAG: ATP-dependent helicase HelY, partial [Actinomycetota bacterium]|nr:ATP-dependent helicase HelY [Actinomycetota bacterium]
MATSTGAAEQQLEAFAKGYDFPFDDFQVQACRAVEAGAGVLVAAPTGAGKTIVGEFAVFLALATGRKAFYTTPIKALSNQKYADLVRRHGTENVGLLTGDSSINGEAPVVVMTTEVLRNMMYAGSGTLRGLGFVVMDEVHYLADRFRGAVWEEVIIHLPDDVQVVSLSATVSNAEEFGAWLGEVRGETAVIVEEHRPVPLWQHMMVGQSLYDLFADEIPALTGVGDPSRVNPDLLERIRSGDRDSGQDRGPFAKGRRRSGAAGRGRDRQPERRGGRFGGGPSRTEVIDRLDRDGLLPAITFIFSRIGCSSAVGQLLASGKRLIPAALGVRIRHTVVVRFVGLADEDLVDLGYWEFVE